MTDIDTAPLKVQEPDPRRSSRGLLTALGVAAVVLLVIGALSLITLTDQNQAPAGVDDPGSSAPLDVIAQFNAHFGGGDIEAYEALIHPEAEFFTEQWRNLTQTNSWYASVTGMQFSYDCTAADDVVICDIRRISGLAPGEQTFEVTAVYLVEDGLIVAYPPEEYLSAGYQGDRANLGDYREWVRDNRPSEFDSLFLFSHTFYVETEEARAGHREMIRQYLDR
jgi:hypothetical protein